MKKIKQVYYHYLKWEDFLNGMYDAERKENEEELINNAIHHLKDDVEFYKTSLEVICNWKISASVNLSNVYCNRRAWVGHSSCNYKFGVPEILTRLAWAKLSDGEKNKANNIADKIIRIYERENREICNGLGAQMLY